MTVHSETHTGLLLMTFFSFKQSAQSILCKMNFILEQNMNKSLLHRQTLYLWELMHNHGKKEEKRWKEFAERRCKDVYDAFITLTCTL